MTWRWLLVGLLVGGCAPPLAQSARTVKFPDGAARSIERDGKITKYGPSEITVPRRTALPLCYEFSCSAHPYHLDTQCRCRDGTEFRLNVDTTQ